jgi:hypothetical protein
MKRSLRITRNITLALLLLLLLVPRLVSEGAKIGLRHYLQESGMTDIEIGSLWLNPYTGYAELENIRFQHQQQPYQLELLQADIALSELWQQKITIDLLQLKGLDLDIVETDATGLTINGIQLPAAQPVADDEPVAEDAASWNFAVMRTELEQVTVLAQTKAVNAQLQLQTLTLHNLDTQLASEATLEGRLDLMELNLLETGQTVATTIQLTSRVKVGQTQQGWNISGSNTIALTALDTVAAPYHLSADAMTLAVDGDLNIAEQLSYHAKATFTLQKLLIAEIDNTTANETPVLQLDRGDIASDLVIDFSEQGWDLASKTNIQLAAIQAVAAPYRINTDSVAVEINTQLNNSTQLSYRSELNAQLQNIALADNSSDDSLLTLAAVNINKLQLDSSAAEQMMLTSIKGDGLVVLPAASEKQWTLLDNGTFEVANITLQLPATADETMAIAIERVVLPQADVQFLRTASGDFPQLQPLLSSSPQAPAAADTQPPRTAAPVAATKANGTAAAGTVAASPAKETTAPAGPQVTVAEIQLGPEVNVRIEDRGVVPTLKESIHFKQFNITNFSLSGSDNAQLQATLGLSHDAVLAMTGDFNLLAQSAKLQVNLKDYQVLQASGYSAKTIGYAVDAGTMDLNSTINISNDNLDLDNKFRFDQLSLRAANDVKALNFVNQLAMPLDQALDLLRDSKNRIKLSVPVTGPLNEPNVDFNNIINKAMGGAMKMASISVLKTLLEPYSTVFTVVKFAGEQLNKVRLEPIQYASAEAELSAQGRDYASKIAAILTSKDKVILKVCGVTNSEDARLLSIPVSTEPPTAAAPNPEPASGSGINPDGQNNKPMTTLVDVIDEAELANKLYSLAQQRSDGLRSYLIDELKVDKTQLLVCLPTHNEAKGTIAGVELLL